ncbi:MAG: ATP-binding region, ATPase domain protein, partial [Frankiales bacterium]|nr:ATP-binding region, ATPase domain protein [Frankiales bacterium]
MTVLQPPARVRRAVSALPLRARLVAGFVVAITVVLTLAGAFVYWRVEYALDRRLDSDLRADAAAVAPVLGAGGRLGTEDATRTPAARRYQVVGPTGEVLASGADVGPSPLLTATWVAEARRGPVVVNIGELLPVSRRPLRVLAEPLAGRPPGTVLVVAERRDQRDEALRELVAQLAAAGLAALVVTAVVGNRLARAALAPVERYRAQAATIAGGATGVRLEVPASRDDEVTRLGHTLNDVLDALEQGLARERRFTQDASHELRTPLTLLS